MSRRDNCTACTFLRNGVKTRRTIPHTCDKTTDEIMKIIKAGRPKPNDQPVKKTCVNCGCVFEYVKKDIKHDFRDGDYVICPNDDCKSYINT